MSNDNKVKKKPGKRLTNKQLSIQKLLPNILTTIGMCAGLTAIRFALEGDWEKAVFAILVAAAFDTIDGLSARLFGASSRFGAELDSLADVISFGVAPAVVIYAWIGQDIIDPAATADDKYLLKWYWIPILAYTTCNALRLARFNVMHGAISPEAKQERDNNYLVGVPAPAAAGLVSMPLAVEFILHRFEVPIRLSEYPYPLLILGWTMVVSVLMISRLPTFSFKNVRFRVPQHQAIIVLLLTSLSVAVFLHEPWIFLFSLGLIYLGSIPFSVWAYGIDKNKDKVKKNG